VLLCVRDMEEHHVSLRFEYYYNFINYKKYILDNYPTNNEMNLKVNEKSC